MEGPKIPYLSDKRYEEQLVWYYCGNYGYDLDPKLKDFCTRWANNLCVLTGAEAGGADRVAVYMSFSLAKIGNVLGNRHWIQKVWSPFFWVEPTSLIPKSQTQFLSELDARNIARVSPERIERASDLFDGVLSFGTVIVFGEDLYKVLANIGLNDVYFWGIKRRFDPQDTSQG